MFSATDLSMGGSRWSPIENPGGASKVLGMSLLNSCSASIGNAGNAAVDDGLKSLVWAAESVHKLSSET